MKQKEENEKRRKAKAREDYDNGKFEEREKYKTKERLITYVYVFCQHLVGHSVLPKDVIVDGSTGNNSASKEAKYSSITSGLVTTKG